jgi:hypothetical protein
MGFGFSGCHAVEQSTFPVFDQAKTQQRLTILRVT